MPDDDAPQPGGINDIGLRPETVAGAVDDYDAMPDFGARVACLQPGRYQFQLPENLAACYLAFDCKIPMGGNDSNGKANVRDGQRINVVFDASSPLTILTSPVGKPDRVGEAHQCRISNLERWRTKNHELGEGILASEMDYLFRGLGQTGRPKVDPANPADNINAAFMRVFATLGGGTFWADVGLTYNCSKRRDIYALDGEGTSTVVEGFKGNGGFIRHGEVSAAHGMSAMADAETGLFPGEIKVLVDGLNPADQQPIRYEAIVRAWNEFVRFIPPM